MDSSFLLLSCRVLCLVCVSLSVTDLAAVLLSSASDSTAAPPLLSCSCRRVFLPSSPVRPGLPPQFLLFASRRGERAFRSGSRGAPDMRVEGLEDAGRLDQDIDKHAGFAVRIALLRSSPPTFLGLRCLQSS